MFANSKIIYSISKTITNEGLGERFGDMLANSTQLKSAVITPFKGGTNDDLYKGGAKNADVVYLSHPDVSDTIRKSIKSSSSKKVLNFNPADEDLNTIIELYSEISPEEKNAYNLSVS